jgi:hypothetical protein
MNFPRHYLFDKGNKQIYLNKNNFSAAVSQDSRRNFLFGIFVVLNEATIKDRTSLHDIDIASRITNEKHHKNHRRIFFVPKTREARKRQRSGKSI